MSEHGCISDINSKNIQCEKILIKNGSQELLSTTTDNKLLLSTDIIPQDGVINLGSEDAPISGLYLSSNTIVMVTDGDGPNLTIGASIGDNDSAPSLNIGTDDSNTTASLTVEKIPNNLTIGENDSNTLTINSNTTVNSNTTFIGTTIAPTVATSTNNTEIATTAFVKSNINELIDSAPETLNTLNELSAALNDDENFGTTILNSLNLKAPIDNPTFTGIITGNVTGDVTGKVSDISNHSINGLSDVDTTTVEPEDGQILAWDNNNNEWKPKDDNIIEVIDFGLGVVKPSSSFKIDGISENNMFYYTNNGSVFNTLPSITVSDDAINYLVNNDLSNNNEFTFGYQDDTITVSDDYPVYLIYDALEPIVLMNYKMWPRKNEQNFPLKWKLEASNDESFSAPIELDSQDISSSYIANTNELPNYTDIPLDNTPYGGKVNRYLNKYRYYRLNITSGISNNKEVSIGELVFYKKADEPSSLHAGHLLKINNNGTGLELTRNIDITGDVTGKVSDISNHNTDSLGEGTLNKYFTNSRSRSAISVNDTGGDGALSYDSTTGQITYIGPSATETRSHFSGGTGVSITNGAISIGQQVGTSDNVTFNELNIVGNSVIGEDSTDTMTVKSETSFLSTVNFDTGTLNNLNVTDNITISGTSSNVGLTINNTNSDTSNDPTITLQSDSVTKYVMGIDRSDNDKFKIGTTSVDTNTRFSIDTSGNVGIGTNNPISSLQIQVPESKDATDASNFDHYGMIISKVGTPSNGTETGLCFDIQGSNYPKNTRGPGAAITHERTSSWSQGKLHFKTKQSNAEDADCVTAMTIAETGNVGIGNTSPNYKLDVNGTINSTICSTGKLMLNDSSNNNISLQSPSLLSSYTLTLPATYGNNNQVLQTNGSGTLSWVDQTTAISNLSDISDVSTTGPTSGQILIYNGSKWEPGNILSGLTATETELNVLDGDTTATATTIVNSDRVVLNDSGTMKQVAVTDLRDYLDDAIVNMPNLTSVGTLTSLQVDNINIDGNTISSTNTDGDITIDTNGTGKIYGDNIIVNNIKNNLMDTNIWSTQSSNSISNFGGYSLNETASGENNMLINEIGPFGDYEYVWKCIASHIGTNTDGTLDTSKDGGWNYDIDNVDYKFGYLSVVYFKVVNDTSGKFYHGCLQNGVFRTDGTTNSSSPRTNNPYFAEGITISNFEQNEWYVSIGIILPYKSGTGGYSPAPTTIGGIYRLSTGEKLSFTHYDYMMNNTTTTQRHRAYLYYSSSNSSELHFARPGFYKINGTEPTLTELLGGNTMDKSHIGNMGQSGHAGFSHVDNATTTNYALLQNSSGDTFINAASNQDISFRIENNDKMIIDSAGNVGIGTTSPSTLLELSSNEPYLTLTNTTDENTDGGAKSKIIFNDHSDISLAQIQASHDGTSNDTKGDLIFSTNSGSSINEALRIDSSGNLGIGTTSPTEKLDVNGNIKLNGELYFDGGTDFSIYIADYTATGSSSSYLAIKTITDAKNIYFRSADDSAKFTFILNNSSGNSSLGINDGSLYVSENVGIGTMYPSVPLHISSSTVSNKVVESNTNLLIEDGDARLQIISTDSDGEGSFIALSNAPSSGSQKNWVFHHSGPNTDNKLGIYYKTNTTTNTDTLSANTGVGLTLDTSGNVGIGTTSPSSGLHIKTQDEQFRIQTTRSTNSFLNLASSGVSGADWDLRYSSNGSGNGDRLWFWYGGDQRFYTNGGTDRMIIKSNGNVGIGTTSPDYKLDVNGSANISSNLNIGQDLDIQGKIKGDVVIGEDANDYLVVNSETKFSNDVDVGTDLVVSNTISAKNVNEDIRNKAYTLNNKIDTHNDSWTQLGQDLVGDLGDFSGTSVSLNADGTIVAIGAYYHDVNHASNNSTDEGITRIYQYSSNTWSQLGQDLVGDLGDFSGYSVSLSADGTIVAIGAIYYEEGDRGRTRIWKYRTVSVEEWNSSDIFIATAGQTGVGDNDTSVNSIRGEAYSSTTKYWIQLGQDLVGDDSDNSGISVSLSTDGTIVAIGAYSHDVGTNTNEGITRIYQYSSNTWTQLGQDLVGDAGDWSGKSVSLSADGTIVAIGAYLHDATAGGNQGRTRIYQYSSNTWTKLGQDLVGDDGDYSGGKVSLSADGTIIAIGAINHDATTDGNEGRTRIYQYSSNTWSQLGQDLVGDTGDMSGSSVSLSADGTIVAISAYAHDVGTDTNEGITRIYQYSSNTWSQLGQDLVGDAGDMSGISVSLSADGTIVAIGAYNHDVTSGSNEGRTIIYHLSEYFKSNVRIDNELHVGKDLVVSKTISAKNVNEDIRNKAYTLNNKIDTHNNSWAPIDNGGIFGESGDNSGSSVSLSADGTIVAIGAYNHDDSLGYNTNKGTTRIYQYSSDTWTQLGSDIDGDTGDHSGHSVSLSADGTIVAIGSYYYSSYKGRTRIYKYISSNSPSWTQLGQDLIGDTGDRSGQSVSLSTDGTIIAIGAYYHGSSNQGRTRIYQYSSNTWTQLGVDIIGGSGDESGYSVSLNADGTIVAIGAHVHDSTTNGNQGRTRIYQYSYSSNGWSQLGQDLVGNTGDYSGKSVSLSADGTIVAIGAENHGSSNQGRTRIYQYSYSSNGWSQLGQDLVGDTGDYSGRSVSLSADGTIVAIGAKNHDVDTATYGVYANEGITRIYQYSSNTWIQLGQDLVGEEYSDQSGNSVSLSADGTIVAIGAYGHDVGSSATSDEGRTRIYHLSEYFKSNLHVNGNVGIGTTNPSAKLHVSQNTANFDIFKITGYDGRDTLKITTPDTSVGSPTIFNTNNAYSFNVDSSSALYIKDDGNVGIGTTSPSAKLHVNGTLISAERNILYSFSSYSSTYSSNNNFGDSYRRRTWSGYTTSSSWFHIAGDQYYLGSLTNDTTYFNLSTGIWRPPPLSGVYQVSINSGRSGSDYGGGYRSWFIFGYRPRNSTSAFAYENLDVCGRYQDNSAGYTYHIKHDASNSTTAYEYVWGTWYGGSTPPAHWIRISIVYLGVNNY